jgi:hypothetical protein
MKPIKPTDATLFSLLMYDPEGRMHPDRLPWRKQCRDVRFPGHYEINCAYTDRRLAPDDEHWTKDNPFPCWHRTDGGFYRVCAGWAAAHRKTK